MVSKKAYKDWKGIIQQTTDYVLIFWFLCTDSAHTHIFIKETVFETTEKDYSAEIPLWLFMWIITYKHFLC